MRPNGTAVAVGVHLAIVEVVGALGIGAEFWVVLDGTERERSTAAPATHKLRGHKFLFFRSLSVLAKEIAKRADVLLHAEIGDVASVAREDIGLWGDRYIAALVDLTNEELTCLDRLFPATGLFGVNSFDERMRETVAISAVFVRTRKRRNGFEV
jgi:hypothetical protein